MLVDTINKVKNVSIGYVGSNGLFDSATVNAYTASLRGLSETQAKVVLSSTTLDKAQQKQIITKLAETSATVSLTSAEATEALTRSLGSKEAANELLVKSGLVTEEQLLAGSTIEVTSAKIADAVATGVLTKEEGLKISTAFGLTGANIGLGTSFDLLAKSIWVSIKAMTKWLVTNPVGWVVLAGGALFGLTKLFDAVTISAEELNEQLQELKATEEELDSTQSKIDDIDIKIAEIKSKGTLSITDSADISRLEQEKALLNDEILLLKARKELQQDEYNKSAKQYANEQYAAYTNRNSSVSALLNKYTGYKEKSQRTDIDDYFIKDAKKGLKETEAELIEYRNTINKNLSNLAPDDEESRKKLEAIREAIEELIYTEEELAKIKFDRFIIDPNNTGISKGFEKIKSDGEVTTQEITELASKFPTLKKFMDDNGISAEILAAELNNVGTEAENSSNGVDTLTAELESLNKELDNIQSAYQTVKSAIDEYNESGYLSVDTYQELMSLEPEYLQYLMNEEGNLDLTTQALNDKTSALIDNMAMKQMDKIIDWASGLTDEEKQLYLTKTATDEATGSLAEYIAMKMTAMRVSGEFSEEELKVLESYMQNAQDWAEKAKAGLGKGGSDKNNALDDYLKKAEASLKFHKDELKYIDELQYAYDNLAKTDEERADILEKMDKAREDYTKREIEAIDNIQSAYKTLQTALEEKNEHGNISVDTLQSLLELEPQYINMIIDENGNLALNEQTVQNCTAAYIDNLAAKSALNLIDSVSHLKTEQEQLALLTGEAQQTGEALWDLVAAQLAVVTASSSAEVGAALTRQVEAIKNMAASAKAGLAKGGLTGFESSKERENLAEKEADFAEKMADAWKKEHLERLKDGLEKQKDIIDRYKKNVEVLDFGLDHIEADDFENRSDLLSDKLDKLKSYGTAMRAEFERISNIMPQTGDEAAELASRMEELGSEMRDNVSTIRETVTAIQMLNIDIASTLIDDRMGELQSQLDNIDRRIAILNSDYKDEYRYASNVLSMDMLLPMSTEYDKKRREKQRADKALIKTEQETQDKINEIVTKSLEMQAKENAAAREKERQNLIKDMEKARQEASKKLAQAHQDYKGFLKDNEIETDKSLQNIEEAFRNANLEFSEIDSTKLEQSIEEVIKKMSGKTIDVTVNVKEGSYQPGSDVSSSGTPSGVQTSSKIPLSESTAAAPEGTEGSKQGSLKCVKYAYARKKEITGYTGEIRYSGDGKNLGHGKSGVIYGKDFPTYEKYFTTGAIITMNSPGKYAQWGHAIVVESYNPNTKELWYSDNNYGRSGRRVNLNDWDRVKDITGVIPVNVYNKGTPYHPGGLALVGDENYLKGWNKPAPELAVYPGGAGEILGTHGAEIRNLPRGTKVIPAKQTKALLGNIHSYADGTGDITLAEGEATEVTIKFNFDEWYQNEEYLVDSFEEFVAKIDMLLSAYKGDNSLRDQVLTALNLLKEHNDNVFVDYIYQMPLVERVEQGIDRISFGYDETTGEITLDSTPSIVENEDRFLFYEIANQEIMPWETQFAPIRALAAEQERLTKLAHAALPFGGAAPAGLEAKKKLIGDTFGWEWVRTFRGGSLEKTLMKLDPQSQGWQNAIEAANLNKATGADNNFGLVVGTESGLLALSGISDEDWDKKTVHGVTLEEMRNDSNYAIDGSYGEQLRAVNLERSKLVRQYYNSLTDHEADLNAIDALYRANLDDLALYKKFAGDQLYFSMLDAARAPIDDAGAKIYAGYGMASLGVTQADEHLNENLNDSDNPFEYKWAGHSQHNIKNGVEVYNAGQNLLSEKLPTANEAISKLLEFDEVITAPRGLLFSDWWGAYHPMLTGITPQDIAGQDLSPVAKQIYEEHNYEIIVDNAGTPLAHLEDGLSDEEILHIADWLLTNAPENKKYLGGVAYKEINGELKPDHVLKDHTGLYGTEASGQWLDSDGKIYQKGLITTTVSDLNNLDNVTVAPTHAIELPEEYEAFWAKHIAPTIDIPEEVAGTRIGQELSKYVSVPEPTEPTEPTDETGSKYKKVSDNPYIAKAEGFYDEAVNAISLIESEIITELQKVLNDRDMSDLDKSLALYGIKHDAGGRASAAGEAIYNKLVDSYNEWQQAIKDGTTEWSVEVYNAYRDALSDVSDITYDMADSAVQAIQEAAELRWSNSDTWISDRNFYNDWELFDDSEVAAWERVVKWLNKDYPKELDRIKQAEQNLFTARKEAMEKSISDIEDYISARNHYDDWDAYGDSELEAIQRQTKVIEDSYKQRLLSFEEYTKKLEEYSQRVYSLGQSQLDKHLANIDKYIEARNLYNDWTDYSDSEIKAIKRQCEILDEAYALNLISLEDYTERAAEYSKKLYTVAKNNIIDTISDLVEEYEEMKQFESSQLESQKTLLQSYYDVTNAIVDAQHIIDKELNASKSMYEYLNEETRKLLFNQEDYNALSEKLLDIQSEANALQNKYNNDILNASEETIAEITSQYQMQYQTMMKQYEIAKAELDVAKKRQKLDNVLAERNTRMFINGQWQWVANTQNVIDAQNELADAEIQRKKQEASLEQTEAINDFTKQINAIETDLKQIRKKWSDMQEMLEGEADEVAKALEEISKVASPELKRIIEETGGSIGSFSSDLSESITTLTTTMSSDLSTMSTNIGDVIADLQTYSDAIQALIAQISNAEINKDEDVNNGKLTTSEIIALMKENSEKWDAATDEERVDLHATNKAYGDMIGARYDSDAGIWYAANGSPLYSSLSSGGSSSSSGGGSSSNSGGTSNGGSTSTTTTSKEVNTSDQYVKDSSGNIQSNPNWDGKTSGSVGTFYKKHADGTRYTPGGLTALGEEGFEAFITNNGRLIPIAQPTIGNIGAGGVVFNREQMANLRTLWDLSNLSRVSPFVSSSNASSQSTVIDNSIHINGLTVGEKGNEDWINGLRRYVATHK